MLPKLYRLRKEWEIKRVFQKGKSFHSTLFSLLSLPSRFSKNRVTVVVSKKIDKRAVYRNALKRKFREAVHHMVLSLHGSQDIIILPKPVSQNADFHTVKADLERVFEKLKIKN